MRAVSLGLGRPHAIPYGTVVELGGPCDAESIAPDRPFYGISIKTKTVLLFRIVILSRSVIPFRLI